MTDTDIAVYELVCMLLQLEKSDNVSKKGTRVSQSYKKSGPGGIKIRGIAFNLAVSGSAQFEIG